MIAWGAAIWTNGWGSLGGVLERVGSVEASSVDGGFVPLRCGGIFPSDATSEGRMKPLGRSVSLGGVVARAFNDCILAAWGWPFIILGAGISGLRGRGVHRADLSTNSLGWVEGAGDMML